MRIFKPRKRIYEDYAHQFATFLRNFRKEHGYTQQDLAKYIGVSQSCISGIENCYWMPTLNVFMELIDFCVGEDAFFNFMMDNILKI